MLTNEQKIAILDKLGFVSLSVDELYDKTGYCLSGDNVWVSRAHEIEFQFDPETDEDIAYRLFYSLPTPIRMKIFDSDFLQAHGNFCEATCALALEFLND